MELLGEELAQVAH